MNFLLADRYRRMINPHTIEYLSLVEIELGIKLNSPLEMYDGEYWAIDRQIYFVPLTDKGLHFYAKILIDPKYALKLVNDELGWGNLLSEYKLELETIRNEVESNKYAFSTDPHFSEWKYVEFAKALNSLFRGQLKRVLTSEQIKDIFLMNFDQRKSRIQRIFERLVLLVRDTSASCECGYNGMFFNPSQKINCPKCGKQWLWTYPAWLKCSKEIKMAEDFLFSE